MKAQQETLGFHRKKIRLKIGGNNPPNEEIKHGLCLYQ